MSDDDNPLRAEKRKKLKDLRAKGINPYPYFFDRTHSTQDLLKKFEAGEDLAQEVKIAGRVMTKRPMGKAAFLNIQDQSGQMQVYLKNDEVEAEGLTVFEHVDLGDIVGISGTLFRTKTGEPTVRVKKFEMLCKTLEPMPEKYHGLTDTELRYRYRHLDLIMDTKSRQVFETRARIIREVRVFLDSRGFLEVETPMLQPIYGGAAARPFVTHHRALDMKLYLKISPELYLKRLIVGGFEKVYDMNKNFRNEGIDRSHNPEFTMIEWYEAYTDYKYQMKQLEDLVAHVAQKVCGTLKITYQGKPIDLTPPWKRMTVLEAIEKYAKVKIDKMSDRELFQLCKTKGSDLEAPPSRGEMIQEIFELTAESNLWDPIFILDHPIEISPLTKKHRTSEGFVERFEPFIACMELGNAYSELNDPEDQRSRLKEQEAKRIVDEEAHPMDEDFLHAIDVGMPPTGGVGLGIERLVMILTDQASIRDIILFPTMKPVKE